MNSGWKKYLLYGSAIIIGGALVIGGYSTAWTGFGDYVSPNGDFVRGKTLWDWMELLLIPLALAGGAFYLNRAERETERQIATDRQQEAALQSYLDRMSDLLLKENLRTSENEEVGNVARTRTLAVLRGLDARRKSVVLQFLHESKLVEGEKAVVILWDADLSGAELNDVILMRANLDGVSLRGANLERADLTEASLNDADLEFANLQGATLVNVSLSRANLNNAVLSKTDLADAVLKGANFKGATMPDGKKHD